MISSHVHSTRLCHLSTGAGGGSRTHTYSRTADFESAASAISPLRLVKKLDLLYHIIREYTIGIMNLFSHSVRNGSLK